MSEPLRATCLFHEGVTTCTKSHAKRRRQRCQAEANLSCAVTPTTINHCYASGSFPVVDKAHDACIMNKKAVCTTRLASPPTTSSTRGGLPSAAAGYLHDDHYTPHGYINGTTSSRVVFPRQKRCRDLRLLYNQPSQSYQRWNRRLIIKHAAGSNKLPSPI